jgi:hypothetical protein
MTINSTPPPAICTEVLDPQGRGTVLQVVYAHHLDGETLAMRLFDAYGHRPENGDALPDEVPAHTVMELLGAQGAHCAEGWHVSANEPTQEAWDEVWPWAQAQVRRLFPSLTWSVEPERRIALPWDADK